MAEFFLDSASGNFSHTPYLHDFAAFDDHTIVNSTAVDGTSVVSMSGGTINVIALDRQRHLYAFMVGNVRYATSCNSRPLGQYEQATWGHHLFTDTNLLIRRDGAQLPVTIEQRHGNSKIALALIIVPQSRYGDPYLNDATLIPSATCSINWTAVRDLFHHGGGWLNVTEDSNGAHCNILPACCRNGRNRSRVSECKSTSTRSWIPDPGATMLSKKGGSNESNVNGVPTGKGGSMDLDACGKPSGNGGSSYSSSRGTAYAPYCFVDMSDDTFGNHVEKIRLSVFLDDDNNSCRETVSTITDTDGTGYRHRTDMAHGTCLATFPRVTNTTSCGAVHTLSFIKIGTHEVLNTMIDTGTSDSDVARLIVARKYLLEAIDLEIALRPDDKLSWQAQQRLTYIQLLLQDVCRVRARGTNSAALVQVMCRGVLRHLELTLRAARKRPNDGEAKDVIHGDDIERRKECSELHISLCEHIFGGACATLPHAFMQRAHDTLYGVRAEMPVGAAVATDHGYGTLANSAATDTVGVIAAARKKYFGAAIGPAWKNSDQDTWRQMTHSMVSAKLIPGPVLRTSEEIAHDSRRLAVATDGAANTVSSVRATPNSGGACSPIQMVTSAVIDEPTPHAVGKATTKQTYLGHNEEMLMKLQRTDTMLAGATTQKGDRLCRNHEQMDSSTTTMLLVKQNLWLRLQQQLLLDQQPKNRPDPVQPDLVRATYEAATRAELQPGTYHDQGSQWIESRRADPPGDVDHPWHSCSCEEHNWHCDTKGKLLFFVCNLLVYADTPLTGQQWEQQRCIDFHGLMMVSILDILCYADVHGVRRVYRKADFFDDMKALRAYTLTEEPARLTVDDTDAHATFERKRRITNAKAKTAAYKTALAKHQAAQQANVRKRLRQELFTREFERRMRNAATLRASTPRTASHNRGNRLHAAAGSTTPLQCVDSLLLEITGSSTSKLDPGGSDQRINSGGRSLPHNGPAKSPRT
jgi:hypothetical protein